MEYQRLIRINSDGTPRNTVISTEDGKELDNVTRVEWEIEVPSHRSSVRLEVVGTALYAEGMLESILFTCPCCSYSREHKCHDQSTDLLERRDQPASGDEDLQDRQRFGSAP